MAEFDSIFDCTYGSAAFQLSDYSYSEEPIVVQGQGRTGTKYNVSGKGWIEGSSPSDFESKLSQARDGFRVIAQDFRITGLDGKTEVEILAARCNDLGPNVAFKFTDNSDGVALVKQVEFTVTAEASFDSGSDGGIGGVADGFGVSVEIKTDGLKRITRKGYLSQSAASTIYNNITLPALLATYPASKWVASQRFDTNVNDTYLTYEITFEEIQEPFLSARGTVVLDGDLMTRKEIDEEHRKVVSVVFDFAYTGDYQKILDELRGQDTPTRSRWEIQSYKNRRLRGEYAWIYSADNNDLLAWQQGIEFDDEAPTLSATVVPGRSPILFYGAQQARRAVQSGRAVGLRKWVRYPAPLWPARLSAPRKFNLRRINDSEWETTWRYEFIFASGVNVNAVLLAATARPTAVGFLG